MAELSPEDRQRIAAEEKIRMDTQLKFKTDQATQFVGVVVKVFLVFLVLVFAAMYLWP